MVPCRVVITGMGLISPVGNTPDLLEGALRAGRSGVARLTGYGAPEFPFLAAGASQDFHGEIDDFGDLPPGPKKAIRKGLKMMCREIQMGVAASQRAILHAGDLSTYDPERVGVLFGVDHVTTQPDEFEGAVRRCRNESGQFEFSRWGPVGLPQITPLWLLKYLPNMPASHVAIYNDFRGPSNSLTLREAAANLAVGEALAVIQRGAADAMVVGATGTRLHALRSLHIALQETVHPPDERPAETWSRPFDLGRRGTVLAEGAGAVILENETTARDRGATIWGEVVAASSAMAALGRSRADLRRAVAIAVGRALERAGLTPQSLGHVHAHGASSQRMDQHEAMGLAEVFGDAGPPVTCLKSYTGNLGAGSGMVEMIASLLALRSGQLFPTLNCDQLDPQCPIPLVMPGDWDRPAGTSALNLSLTPQGQTSTVVIATHRE